MRIQQEFTDSQQKLFLSSFYCYLNYDYRNDFVINLEDVWKWLGFSRIDHGKRLILRHFIKDKDYIISVVSDKADVYFPPTSGKSKVGRKKETVLMNIITFKKLCLKSGTKKADEIHDYFIKLEEITHTVLSEETRELQNQLLVRDNKIKKIESDNLLHKHDLILKEYSDNVSNIVYIIRVASIDNKYVVKIGESRCGLAGRYAEHRKKYPECTILDCFRVKRSNDFEHFLHSSLREHLYKNLDGHEKEKELFLVGEKLSYNYILNLINDNIKNYNDDSLELNKLKLENENLRLQLDLHSNKNYNVNLNDIKAELYESFDKFKKEIDINLNTKTTNNFGQQLSTMGEYVQQINPETLELIKVFQSVSEACKAFGMPRSSLVKAIKDNTIYKNFRWAFRDRNTDPNIIENVAPTRPLTKIQNNGYIAKLNSDKTEIINVYLDRKTASILNGYNSVAFLDNYVKSGKIIDNYYYMVITDTPAHLQEKYKDLVLYKTGAYIKRVKNEHFV